MYNPQLETFIRVADAESFNKAADESYITPTAMIKQINSLESELGLTLFTRTHRGLVLTRAGESFYKDAKYIIEYSRKAIARAKAAIQEEINVVRIGTSPMIPAQLLTDLWPQVHRHCSDISFQIVPFENTPENTPELFDMSSVIQEGNDTKVQESGKTLVVYYSTTNNTETVAGYIAAATGGELFELVPVESYSDSDLDWTDRNSRVFKEHDNSSLRTVELENAIPEN